MKYKSLFFICLIICSLSIAGVCAGDVNDTSQMEISEDNLMADANIQLMQNATIVENEVLNLDESKFSELSAEIGSGGNVSLKHDYYTYDSGSTIEINVAGSVIDGKGATIDMVGSDIPVFKVNTTNVILKNMTFKNANCDRYGGAVTFNNGGSIIDCSFLNNCAKYGGAIYSRQNSTVIKNCIFINNTASKEGGAIRFNKESGFIEKCIFINNIASGIGGAILTHADLVINDCIFQNNTAIDDGGAIYTYYPNEVRITSSSFSDNFANDAGGAIFSNCRLAIYDCNFTNNAACDYGGAIFSSMVSNKITDSSFINNSATSGGAIRATAGCIEIVNSSFMNNSASNEGGSVNAHNLNISSSQFISNSAVGGGAIYSTGYNIAVNSTNFTSNYAKSFGGAVSTNNAIKNFVIDESNFIDNVAGASAGAIYSLNSRNNFSNSNFVNCSASKFGGAICDLKSISYFNNLKFYSNNAENGGAIYKYYKTLNITHSEFGSNSAQQGGVIYVNTIESCDFNDVSFNDNSADFGKEIFSHFTNDSTITGFEKDICNSYGLNLTRSASDYLIIKYPDEDVNISISRYDLRDYYLLSPVKNQMTEGNCWAFSSIATLESCIIRANASVYDFSEQNMKNIIAYFSDYGSLEYDTNDGVNAFFDVDYLASWMGPVFEENDTYSSNVLSPESDAAMHVQDVLFITRNSLEDIDAIKTAIMKYGAVETSMFYESFFLAEDDVSYYCGYDENSNHAVTIVGWDDNYDREKFSMPPDKDGAFIVRNSWGPDWGEDGYFYVSYYDVVFANSSMDFSGFSAVTFILNNTNHYDKNYQNQILVTGTSDFNESVMFKNVFTCEGDELISAVSTYFYGDYDYDISITVNGEVMHTQSGSLSNGYFTVPLTKQVPIKKDDEFEVIFKFTSRDGSCIRIPIFDSTQNPKFSNSVSFYKTDGEWVDFGTDIVAIKAFINYGKLNTSIDVEGLVESFAVNVKCDLNVIVNDQYGNPVNDGNVMLSVDGKNYTAVLHNGVSNITVTFESAGDHEISLLFCDEPYYHSSNATELVSVNVAGTAVEISIVNSDLSVGDGAKITVDVNASEGKLMLYVNGILKDIRDVNGSSAIFVLRNLTEGDYAVFVNYTDEKCNYLSSSKKTSFKVSKNDIDINIPELPSSDSGSVTAKLPEDASGTITLSINGKEYKFNVVDGTSIIKMPELPNGKYSYSITYSGNDKYSSFTKTGNVTVKKPVLKTKLTLKKVKVKRSAKKLTIKATLKVKGKAVKGKIIKFKFNKKFYKAKTNSKGIAKITVKKKVLKKLKKGKKVTYSAKYKKIIKKVTVKVRK